MLLYFLLYNIFTSLVYGSNMTFPEVKSAFNKTLTSAKHVHKGDQIKKNVTLPSEGGSIIEESPILSLPKENHTILMSLDRELGKNKEKPVVPRKGVVYDPSEDNISLSKSSTELKEGKSVENKLPKEKDNEVSNHYIKNTTNLPSIVKINLKENNTLSNVSAINTEILANKSEVLKKPLFLSYEALNMGEAVNKNQLPSIKSSKKTIMDQIPSPNKENGPNVKIQPMNASRHPGMIMPIVITILVVPMFAVLGYMALRRGQEAWKNRHYKRMDFLLDGMYND